MRKDPLTPSERSYCMSKVRSKDTDLEVAVRCALHRQGYRFRKHVDSLPGKPDIVFPTERVAVYVDGDFWHGYRFPEWAPSVTPFWQEKIAKNRQRDQRNFRKLRRWGWRVIRLWQHDVERDLPGCIRRVVTVLRERQGARL